jgi:hypothetical protein
MNNLAKLGLCLIPLSGFTASFPVLAQVWEPVCNEGHLCEVVGTRPIRYGAGEDFNYEVASGLVHCSDESFGDPAPGARKRCYAYYTAEEQDLRKAVAQKDDRIRLLERELQALQSELKDTNVEIEGLYRELRRERRRDARRDRRRERSGPIIIERP